jgi:hypothetical protein
VYVGKRHQADLKGREIVSTGGQGRDFVIADRNKMVVAHAADGEYHLGEKFDHDPGCV